MPLVIEGVELGNLDDLDKFSARKLASPLGGFVVWIAGDPEWI